MDQPGAAAHGDPGLAGDRRPTLPRCSSPSSSAPTRSCASCCPRLASRGIHDICTALRAVRLSTLFFVLTCVITLATHETVGWITIVLFFLGPRHPHVGRAVPLRLGLDPRGGADGPAASRRLPGRLPSSAAPWAGSGRRRSTASSPWSGAPSAGSSSPRIVTAGAGGAPRRPRAPPAASSSSTCRPTSWPTRRAGAARAREDAAAAGPPSMLEADAPLPESTGDLTPLTGSPAPDRAPSPPRSRPCSPAPAWRRTSTRRCGGRPCSPWSSASPCRSASTTPTTTPTASAAPTPTASARCGSSARGRRRRVP